MRLLVGPCIAVGTCMALAAVATTTGVAGLVGEAVPATAEATAAAAAVVKVAVEGAVEVAVEVALDAGVDENMASMWTMTSAVVVAIMGATVKAPAILEAAALEKGAVTVAVLITALA